VPADNAEIVGVRDVSVKKPGRFRGGFRHPYRRADELVAPLQGQREKLLRVT